MTPATIDHETGEIIEEEEMRLPARLERGSDLERRQMVGGLLKPIARPAELLKSQNDMRELIAQALKEGRDHGKVPGIDKPFLQKPGAERVCAAFGVVPRFRIMEKEIDHNVRNEYTKRKWEWHPSIRGQKVWTEEQGSSDGLYRYVLACELVHRESGVVVGEGVGSCSTMETKYIDRPRDSENTVLKMAKKRAHIDATLTTFGLSEQFTQDEDFVEGAPPEKSGRSSGPFSLDDLVGFGKHQTKTWKELIAADRQYVEWALENTRKLNDDAKAAIRAALGGGESASPEADEEEDHPFA